MKTHFLASAMVGHESSDSYRRFVKFLKIKPVLVYLHRNSEYAMTKNHPKGNKRPSLICLLPE